MEGAGGDTPLNQWYDLTGEGEEEEWLEVDVVQVRSGRSVFAWTLARRGTPTEERVVVTVRGGTLFDPHFSLSFPPSNFTFKNGVPPFIMAAVSDKETPAVPADATSVLVIARPFDGSDRDWESTLSRCATLQPHLGQDSAGSVSSERVNNAFNNGNSNRDEEERGAVGTSLHTVCTSHDYCELTGLSAGRYLLQITLRDLQLTPYKSLSVGIQYQPEDEYFSGSGARPSDFLASCPDSLGEPLKDQGSCNVPAECHVTGMGKGACQECSGHGTCNRSVCVCDPLHFGASCEYALFATRAYVPAIHPQQEAQACQRALHYWEGRRELEVMLSANQKNTQRATLFPYDVTSALGVSVRSFVLAVGSAMQRGVAIDFPPNWTLLSYPACSSGHLRCYFEPFSSFSGSTPTNTTLHDHDHDEDPFLKCCRNMPVQYTEMAIPEPFRRKGAFWFTANVADMLLRPNRVLSDMIRRAEKVAGLSGPCIGLHARVGDACMHSAALTAVGGAISGRRCYGVDTYLDAVRSMREAYGADDDVFVATDSAEMTRSLQRAAPEIRWRFLPGVNRTQLNSGLPFMLAARLGLIDRRGAVESALLDLFLLSRCRSLVGHFSSSFTVLTLELITATQGFLPPFIAVDGPLSLAFGPPLEMG